MDIRRAISIIFDLADNTDQVNKYHTIFKWVYDNHPDQLDRWMESIAPNQIKCKKWLVEELGKIIDDKKQYWKEDEFTVELIGGWFAWPLLDYMDQFPIEKIRNVDLDPFCAQLSQKYYEVFQPSFEYQFVNEDIINIRQHSDTRKTRFVINTSCEHMRPMNEIVEAREYIKEKIVMVLQSNNKTDEPDHINCVSSAEELAQQSGCQKIYYMGEKDMGDYKRFMVIGK